MSKNLIRKQKVSLNGFGDEPFTFNLHIPTKAQDKLEIQKIQDRISKISKGDSANKEEGDQKTNLLMAEAVFKYSDIKDKTITQDDEEYKIESAQELLDILGMLELPDFFMCLLGDIESTSRLMSLAKVQK